MKLRTFLYLNKKIIEDYLAVIDGYTYDEESRETEKVSENTAEGKVGAAVVAGKGAHSSKEVEGVRKSVRISSAAKFDRVFEFLKSQEEDEQVKYYESLSADLFSNLRRDDFMEVLVSARFSKMKDFVNSVEQLGKLAIAMEKLTDEQILDQKTRFAVEGVSALSQYKQSKAVSCVFEFEDGKYPLIACLDESYFQCEQASFVGDAYLLCKILKKIPEGESVRLDEVLANIEKLPLNQEQRSKLPNDMSNPEVLRDEINGPALLVVPIAFYQ